MPNKTISAHDQDKNEKTKDHNKDTTGHHITKGNKSQHGKQGFASVPHDKVVEIAHKESEHNHDNNTKGRKGDTGKTSSRK
jgi:hypothetical protein